MADLPASLRVQSPVRELPEGLSNNHEGVAAAEAAPGELIPLAVDLDGTLLRADTLHEGVAALLLRRPWLLVMLVFAMVRGKAAFKAYVATHAPIEVDGLPVSEGLLAFLRDEKSKGRRIGLFSAADQRIVDAAAARFGLFDVAIGSDGRRNLSGKTKLRVIQEVLGQRFVYAGDCGADWPVWRAAERSIYAGRSTTIARRLTRDHEVEGAFLRERAGLRQWLFALRAHQWPKNGLVFVPALLAIPQLNLALLLQFVMAFAALCAAASATYLYNDLGDVSDDRRHRYKSRRPLASGLIPMSHGVIAAILLAGAALALAAQLPAWSGLLVIVYAVSSVFYSLALKRVAVLDVILLGALFTVRIAVGAALLPNASPYWLFAFSMFFFTSLALVKRHSELQLAIGTAKEALSGRGYQAADLPLVLASGVASAFASLVVFLIYLGDQHFDRSLFENPGFLGFAPALLGFWILRVWLLTLRGEMHDDPVVFALRDRTSYVVGAGVAVALFLAW